MPKPKVPQTPEERKLVNEEKVTSAKITGQTELLHEFGEHGRAVQAARRAEEKRKKDESFAEDVEAYRRATRGE